MMRKRGKCENRNRFFSLVATFYCIFHSRKINVAYNVHVIHTLISKDVRIFQNIWFRDNFIFWNVVPRIFSIEIIQVYFPNKNVHHVVIYEWRINNVKPTNRNFLIPSTFNKCYHIARNEQDMKGCVLCMYNIYGAIGYMKYYALSSASKNGTMLKCKCSRVYLSQNLSQIFYLFISVKGKKRFHP